MRIVLCDSQKMFIEALGSVLTSRGFVVCALAFTPEGAQRMIETHLPDVGLVSYRMTGTDTFLRSVASVTPPTRIVLLLDDDEDAATLGSRLEAGSHGVASKRDDIDRIVNVIERVGHGECVAPPTPARLAASRRQQSSENTMIERLLTQREREILDRLVRGERTTMIAAEMGISINTARTHIQNVMTKLGAHSRLEVVAVAIRAGRARSDST
jgi:two-component system, NarL family, nitrate/nitrite response regulator NarL